MKRHEPAGIGDILRTLAKTTKLGEALEKARVWEHWPALVGQEAAGHCRPRTIQDGQLRIEAESAVWMHRLVYAKWDIVRRVNQLAGKELVHDIYVTLPPDGESVETERPQ